MGYFALCVLFGINQRERIGTRSSHNSPILRVVKTRHFSGSNTVSRRGFVFWNKCLKSAFQGLFVGGRRVFNPRLQLR